MGVQRIDGVASGDSLRAFTLRVLRDVEALEAMLARGRIESGVHRVGAEQEVFLVDSAWRAAPVAPAVLARAGAEGFVPEIGTFQAEINLDPFPLGAQCFTSMHAQLDARLAKLRKAAEAEGARVALFGILPTLRRRDCTLENLTDRPRYHALNEAIARMRGGAYDFRITGADELVVREDSVMLEAATSSFQVHLQVDLENFARFYNAAQLAVGPQLASGANSPLLFGKRLWSETRIVLFQQAADTRRTSRDPARQPARAMFGSGWVQASPVEVFREDVARFPTLIVAHGERDEDPVSVVEAGGVPSLEALRVHTSTVYRWNRVCYGAHDGIAHLRIENRVLPSGPTTLDEIANAAFWVGLTCGIVAEYGDVSTRMSFEAARANFHEAARAGLGAELRWIDGSRVPARELIRDRLVPLAREGLAAHGVSREDSERYLGVILARVTAAKTGARWIVDSDASMRDSGTRGQQLAALVAAAVSREATGKPVHEWQLAEIGEAGGPAAVWDEVEQVMISEFVTVREDDALALAEAAMNWQGIDYVPVEGPRGAVVGIVSRASLAGCVPSDRIRPAGDCMDRHPICVPPETPTAGVLQAMRERGADCVLVVRNGTLVGLVTGATLASAARSRPSIPG